jgi:hypothetical protein
MEIAPLAPEAADLVTDDDPSPSPRRSSVTSHREMESGARVGTASSISNPPHSRPRPLEVAASPMRDALVGHPLLASDLASMELRMQTSTGEWQNIPVRSASAVPLRSALSHDGHQHVLIHLCVSRCAAADPLGAGTALQGHRRAAGGTTVRTSETSGST